MGLAAIFKRLLRGPERPPIATRLSEAEVIELARQAAGDHWLRNTLNVATPERTASGAVIWNVQSNGVGASLRIVIDDASSAILERVSREGR